MKFVIQRVTHASVTVEGKVLMENFFLFLNLRFMQIVSGDIVRALQMQELRIWQMRCISILFQNVKKLFRLSRQENLAPI